VRVKSDGRHDLGSAFHLTPGDHDLAAPDAGKPRYGRRIGRRAHPVAQRPLQRGGVRHRHSDGAAPRADPGRRRAAWTVRVAAAGPVLARPYRDHALAAVCALTVEVYGEPSRVVRMRLLSAHLRARGARATPYPPP